jgi:hypothetical protein
MSNSLFNQVADKTINKNVAGGTLVSNGVLLPWPSDPASSWVYYDCAIGSMLDSGIVVHNRLPQVNNTPDSLGSRYFDDPNMAGEVNSGVNLKCSDQYTDIVQRMGHARYWFRLWGRAMRVGYQIPIPALRSVGGVSVVPYDKNPQWAYNKIAPNGNYGGVVLWMAEWSLWYTTASPPTSNTIPVNNPGALLPSAPTLPAGIQAPYSPGSSTATLGRIVKAP